MTGADRIPINPFGGDLLATPSLYGIVEAQQNGAMRHEDLNQALQPSLGHEPKPRSVNSGANCAKKVVILVGKLSMPILARENAHYLILPSVV